MLPRDERTAHQERLRQFMKRLLDDGVALSIEDGQVARPRLQAAAELARGPPAGSENRTGAKEWFTLDFTDTGGSCMAGSLAVDGRNGSVFAQVRQLVRAAASGEIRRALTYLQYHTIREKSIY